MLGCLGVFIIYQTLTGTTGSLMCVRDHFAEFFFLNIFFNTSMGEGVHSDRDTCSTKNCRRRIPVTSNPVQPVPWSQQPVRDEAHSKRLTGEPL